MTKYQKEIESLLFNYEKDLDKKLYKAYTHSLSEIKREIKPMMENIDKLNYTQRQKLIKDVSLQLQIEKQLDYLGGYVTDNTYKYLNQTGEIAYNGLFYEFEQTEGLNTNFTMLPTKTLETIVQTPVEGLHFSERIQDGSVAKLRSNFEEVFRIGFTRGHSYEKMARRLSDVANSSYKRSMRIARTEGGRVQAVTRQMSQQDALELGIRTKKEWVSTLDGSTRDSHRKLDGQIREVNEYFEVNGHKALQPHMFGIPEEDIHCRCRSILILDGYDHKLRRDNKTKKPIKYQNYNEWEKAKNEDVSKNDSIKSIIDKMNSIDITKAKPMDLISLGKEFNDVYQINEFLGEKEKITEILNEFRPMNGEIPKETWYNRTNKEIKSQIEKAFSYYPKDWAKIFEKNNKKLFAGKSDRGFFSPQLVNSKVNRYLKGARLGDGVSIYANGVRETTAFHEIGHLVEHFNPDLLRISKEFVAYRTEGEEFTKLKDIFPGMNYGPNEITKKDDFISPYIGKSYDNASEVLSVGLESIFEPGKGHLVEIGEDGSQYYSNIRNDPEYLSLIIGMILKG